MTTELEPLTLAIEAGQPTTPKTLPALTLKPIDMGDIQAHLDAQKAECLAFVVTGPDDRAGRDLAYSKRQTAKNTRIPFEKWVKEVLAEPKAWMDDFTQIAKSYVAEFKAIESHLSAQEKIVDDAIEAAKLAKEQAAAAKILNRMNSLMELGGTFENGQYQVYGVFIDAIEVKALPDDEWAYLYASASDASVQHHAEVKRLADEEAERLRVAEQQRQAELIRLENQKKEQEAAQADIQRQQQALKQQQEDMNRMVLDSRKARLVDLGWKDYGNGVAYAADHEKWKAMNAGLLLFSVADFETYVANFCAYKAEQEAELVKWQSRVERLLAIGFVEDGPYFVHHEVSYDKPDLGSMSDGIFDGFIEGAIDYNKQVVIDEENRLKAEKQAEADRKKADRERSKRLASDKKLLKKFASSLVNMSYPEVVQEETGELMRNQFVRLSELGQRFMDEIDAL